MKKTMLALALLAGMMSGGIALADTASNRAPVVPVTPSYNAPAYNMPANNAPAYGNQMLYRSIPQVGNQNNNMNGRQLPGMQNQNGQNGQGTRNNVPSSGSSNMNRSSYQTGRPMNRQFNSFRNRGFGGLGILFIIIAIITLILVWTALARYIFLSFRRPERTDIRD